MSVYSVFIEHWIGKSKPSTFFFSYQVCSRNFSCFNLFVFFIQVIRGLLKFWPKTCSQKEVGFVSHFWCLLWYQGSWGRLTNLPSAMLFKRSCRKPAVLEASWGTHPCHVTQSGFFYALKMSLKIRSLIYPTRFHPQQFFKSGSLNTVVSFSASGEKFFCASYTELCWLQFYMGINYFSLQKLLWWSLIISASILERRSLFFFF